MTHRKMRHQALGLAGGLALVGSLALAGPSSQAATVNPHPPYPSFHFWDSLQLEPQFADAWARLRENLQWKIHEGDERVQRWIARYRASPQNVVAITERARPWLAWILEQLEKRDLPGELALIPFIESSFDPEARSHRGAAGLWQFMPGTADALGLQRRRGYDGRLDVVASTRAALDYIELQAEQWYDGDIELSLAAYNAGAGTVNRARNAALARGERGDYWSLRLPRETMQYLPKLHALAAIVAEPEAYGIELPAIDTTPAFATITVDRPLELGRLADLADVSRAELAALNPGLTGGHVHPGTAEVVLVPAEQEALLQARLSGPARSPQRGVAMEHVVQRGDTLSRLASRYGLSVNEIRRHNGLESDVIHVGQVLAMPNRSLASR
ncbi:LysM peptidoglycan-binding domain-containing protein [Billgrantia azerbaijanica]|nr:LysM peptidoglycan-binding domain-containing protein [Halomonas azerbaijanica]